MKRTQKGFTLMEMIGVVAVIAILASMATPMIFEAIRNARIATFVQDVNSVKVAVARYYQDTGEFPYHRPSSENDGDHLLLRNDSSSPVSGWDGPYIEKEIENPFSPDSFFAVRSLTDSAHQFDLDSDGNIDTSGVVIYQINGVSDTEARKISDIFDSDGDISSGDGRWQAAGRVKRHGINSDHADALLIYLTRS